jgi:Rap1a immunity proteins
MRRTNVKTVLTVIPMLLVLSGIVTAEELEGEKRAFFTGNDVHSWCQRNRPMAQGYTAGVWDHSARTWLVLDNLIPRGPSVVTEQKGWVEAAVAIGKKLLVGYCEPPRATVDQVTDVFCAYLRDRPGERNAHAALLFNDAMAKAWPCKR